MNGKKKFLKQFSDESKFSNFADWMKCCACCKKPPNEALKIGGVIPKIRNAADPSLLIWENLG
jgi:hypothetical protein